MKKSKYFILVTVFVWGGIWVLVAQFNAYARIQANTKKRIRMKLFYFPIFRSESVTYLELDPEKKSGYLSGVKASVIASYNVQQNGNTRSICILKE